MDNESKPKFDKNKPYERLPDDGNFVVWEQGNHTYKEARPQYTLPSINQREAIVQEQIGKSNPFAIDMSNAILQAGAHNLDVEREEKVGVGKVFKLAVAEAAAIEGATWLGAKGGGATGLATSLGLGVAGPQALLPEEAITAPLFTAVGSFIGGNGGRIMSAYNMSLHTQRQLGLEPSKGMALLDVVLAYNPLGRIAKHNKWIKRVGMNVGTDAIKKLSTQEIISRGVAASLHQTNNALKKPMFNMASGTVGGGVTGGIYSSYTQFEQYGNITLGQILEDSRDTAIFGFFTSGGINILGKGKHYTLKQFDEAVHNKKHAFHKDAKTLTKIMDGQVQATDGLLAKKASEYWMSFKIGFSDKNEFLKRLQKESGGVDYHQKGGILKVTDATDAYAAARIGEQNIVTHQRKASEAAAFIKDQTAEYAGFNGLKFNEMREVVNNYMLTRRYLELNRNNAHLNKTGGKKSPFTGIPDEELQKRLDDIESLTYFPDVKKIVDQKQKLAHEILNRQVDGGIIKGDHAVKIIQKNPFYVPLNRESSYVGKINFMQSNKGAFSDVTPVSQRALSQDPAGQTRDLDVNIRYSLDDSISKAQHNKTRNVAAKLLQANPHVQDYLGKPVVLKHDKTGRPLTIEYDPGHKANELVYYENGTRKAIQFNEKNESSVMLANTLGWMPTDHAKLSTQNVVNTFANTMGFLNKFQAQGLTGLNPEFLGRNLIRDRQEAYFQSLGKFGIKQAFSLFNPKNLFADGHTIWRYQRRNAFAKEGNKQLGFNEPLSKADIEYEEFVRNGGHAGGYGVDFANDMWKYAKELDMKTIASQNFAKNSRNFGRMIESVNAVFEQNSRYNVYKQAKKAGLTPQQAGLAARDSSFDPMLRGRNTNILSAAYIFANPALQSSKNFFRRIDPRTVKGREASTNYFGSLLLLNLASEYHNNSIDPDWRDKIGYQKYNQWDENMHLRFIDPSHKKNVTNSVTGEVETVTELNPNGSYNYFRVPLGYLTAIFNAPASLTARYMMGSKIREIDSGEYNPVNLLAKKSFDTMVDNASPIPIDLQPTLYTNFRNFTGNQELNALGQRVSTWNPNTKSKRYEKDSKTVQNFKAEEKIPEGYDRKAMGIVFMKLAQAVDMTSDLVGQETNITPETLEYAAKTYLKPVYTTLPKMWETTSALYNNMVYGKPLPRDSKGGLDLFIIRNYYGTSYGSDIVKELDIRQSMQSVEDQMYIGDNKAYNNLKGLERKYRKLKSDAQYMNQMDFELAQKEFIQLGQEYFSGTPSYMELWLKKKKDIDNNLGYQTKRIRGKGRTEQARIMLDIKKNQPTSVYESISNSLIDDKIINATTVKRQKILEDLEKNGELIGLSPLAQEELIRSSTYNVKAKKNK